MSAGARPKRATRKPARRTAASTGKSFALTKLTAAEEAGVVALVKNAVS